MRINSDWRNCIRHRFRLNGHRTHIDRDSEMCVCVCKTSFIFKFTFNESVCIIKQYRVLKNVRVSLINCNTYGWVSKWCVTHHYMVEWCYYGIIVFRSALIVVLWCVWNYPKFNRIFIFKHESITLAATHHHFSENQIIFFFVKNKEKTKSNLTKVNYYFNDRVYGIIGLCKRDDYCRLLLAFKKL